MEYYSKPKGEENTYKQTGPQNYLSQTSYTPPASAFKCLASVQHLLDSRYWGWFTPVHCSSPLFASHWHWSSPIKAGRKQCWGKDRYHQRRTDKSDPLNTYRELPLVATLVRTRKYGRLWSSSPVHPQVRESFILGQKKRILELQFLESS